MPENLPGAEKLRQAALEKYMQIYGSDFVNLSPSFIEILVQSEIEAKLVDGPGFHLQTVRYGGEDPDEGGGCESNKLDFLRDPRDQRGIHRPRMTHNNKRGYPPGEFRVDVYGALNPNKQNGKK